MQADFTALTLTLTHFETCIIYIHLCLLAVFLLALCLSFWKHNATSGLKLHKVPLSFYVHRLVPLIFYQRTRYSLTQLLIF